MTRANAQPTPAPAPIHISARRWFDRRYGNTYHSVTVYQGGAIIAEAPFIYGYDRAYEETAAFLIEQAGVIPPRVRYGNGGTVPLRLWAEEHNLLYTMDCVDVQRKKDL